LLPLDVLVETAVDRGNFLGPSPSIGVLQGEDLIERPMKVIGDVGYLLLEPIEGVAYDSPDGKKSTSKLVLHDGQVTAILAAPGSLIRW
jgi:hypothetical protein